MTTPNQCQFWDCDEILRRSNHFLCANHYKGYELEAVDQCPSCGKYKLAEYDLCLNCRRQAPTPRPSPGSARDGALLAELRSLRSDLAQRNGLAEFMVFSNDTLAEMAATRPTTPEGLLSISGVGPAKLLRFGQDFLRVIGDHAGASTGLENQQPPTPPKDVDRDGRKFPADQEATEFFVYILNMDGGEYYIGQTREIHERLLEHRNNMTESTKGRNPRLVWFTTVPTRDDAADWEQYIKQLNSNPTGRREINRWVVQFKQLVDELDYTPPKADFERPSDVPRRPSGGMRPPGRGQQRGGNAGRGTDDMDVGGLPF